MQFEPIVETIKICDISDDEYFGSKYKDYISNSRLKLIDPSEDGTPKKFFEGLHSISTPSLEFGSAVHQMFLQPESFILCDKVSKPTAKMGKMADTLYPIYLTGKEIHDSQIIEASNKVDYYKGKMNDVKITKVREECADYWRDRELFERKDYTGDKEVIYLNAKDRDKVKLCLINLNKNKYINLIMNPEGLTQTPVSLNEQTILMDLKVTLDDGESTILKLKAKFDNLTINPEINEIALNDLKTTGHEIKDFAKGSWIKFHYYRQAAFYSWLLLILSTQKYKLNNPTITSNFMLVSTIPPCNTGVYKVTKKDFSKGLKEVRDLLGKVAYYTIHPNEIY